MSHSQQGQGSQFVKDLLMGGTAGAIAKTVCAPIERVKLLMQSQHTIPELKNNPYTSIGNCFVRCVKEEGPLSLWKGNLANVIRYFPTTAINFATKDFFQRSFVKGINAETQKLQFFLGNTLAGGMAGATSMMFVYPLDYCRTRLANDVGRQYKGLIDCVAKTFKTDGLQGIYRGLSVSLVGIFVYRALYFGTFDTGKRWAFGEDQRKANLFVKFFFAQVCVTFSETVSYPLDTVRRRLMMQSGKGTKDYNGTIDCFKKVHAQEGINGFFKGNLSNVYRSVGSALVLVLYDEFKHWLDSYGKQKN
ncbi:ADP/ATP transporter on adenylate translocase (macronuclear) [Tetrahymena thermophila SB210]|uniref:ADP/ATP translocase n=1 Tax=Tetrahymena thermophila (strain SB210) TaxID=312017 RepID=Q22PC2_TETTS|nr:ADP/ATP transporter on adenylate translocase [Tetrahymena thermophila SB210]EAR87187.1 ADP/ATP transporter on adenylate translocase [Tetrahymena thermophila SB210]|eukprot:XP_001007432.1 ADP/ATP transporter on adenylate translocase [Tetrahymena thermophila SB210]